jgi:ATP-dependent DNA helicase PIF1
VKLSAILGPAGSGKSTRMRERAQQSGESIRLTATTGIASVNLGPSVTTINSLLGFFDEASLSTAIRMGKFRERLVEVSGQFDIISVDEISMMTGTMLQAIVNGFTQVERQTNEEAPELLVLGDHCQLSPVNGSFVFESQAWAMLEAQGNMTKLEGSYRQKDDPAFYEALQAARRGDGINCLLGLRQAGASYSAKVDENFPGITITPLNASVDRINRERFALIEKPEQVFARVPWGVAQAEWKAIPGQIVLKETARVMILANLKDRESGELLFVNGDTGVVADMGLTGVTVTLERNGENVYVPYVTRKKHVQERVALSQWDEREQAWLVSSLRYLPVRLAYATSIHKSQGLTLDKVQLDARTRFAGEPGMMYTALSRCRSAKDLRVVTANAGSFARRINTHPKVRRWI